MNQRPIVIMTKKEVTERRLENVVLCPDDGEMHTFEMWWKSLDEDEDVEVKFPHERHGLAGRPSNHSKLDVMADFLEFVDLNSQPNGRHAGSYNAQFFFIPKFSRIAPPRPGEKNYDHKVKASVVSEFNRAQIERGRGTCGPTAAAEWLDKHRPKIALHPSMTDYCDTCKNLKEELSRNQAVKNRLQQSGNASEADLRGLEEERKQLDGNLIEHKAVATRAREYYKACMQKCQKQWRDIKEYNEKGSLTQEEREELTILQHCFTLVISADYQQSKLIPNWGATEQPGSTYYLQKVSHDIFGIVDHREDKSTVYTFDERIGPKNTDHTVSFLTMYWRSISQQYPWLRRFAIFLDNATSTNKNRYLFAWAMEMVRNGELEHVHISFMIAGHTKFTPDRLFSVIGNAYKAADVFTICELQALCAQTADTFVEDGGHVLTWRQTLGRKYSDLPGVRKLHDFLIVRQHNGEVVMKVRQHCFTGAWKESPLHVIQPDIQGEPATTYKEEQTRHLSAEKMANMITMYDRFIAPDRRPEYLPPLRSTAVPDSHTTASRPTSTISDEPKKRKQSKCSVPGCDGTGHRSQARWNEGHTTKAGCPKVNPRSRQ